MTFGPHTLTVVNRGWDGSTRDRHNNPVVSELGTYDIAGAFVQQRTSDEELDAEESTVTSWLAISPAPTGGNTLGAIDHIRVNAASLGIEADAGQTYASFTIDGVPDTAHHIDGVAHHLELILRRVQL